MIESFIFIIYFYTFFLNKVSNVVVKIEVFYMKSKRKLIDEIFKCFIIRELRDLIDLKIR